MFHLHRMSVLREFRSWSSPIQASFFHFLSCTEFSISFLFVQAPQTLNHSLLAVFYVRLINWFFTSLPDFFRVQAGQSACINHGNGTPEVILPGVPVLPRAGGIQPGTSPSQTASLAADCSRTLFGSLENSSTVVASTGNGLHEARDPAFRTGSS